MDNVSDGTETLRNNLKEILQINNIVTEIKNPYDRFINRLDTIV